MAYIKYRQSEAEIWDLNSGDLHDECRNYMMAKNWVLLRADT